MSPENQHNQSTNNQSDSPSGQSHSIPTVVVDSVATEPAFERGGKTLSEEILESAQASIGQKAEKDSSTDPESELVSAKSKSDQNDGLERDSKLAAETKAASDERENNRTRFADLPLSKQVQQAVTAEGYEFPTAIQEQIIPHVLDGRDVMAQSQTGSGKTAAFALPILSKLDTSTRVPHVIVLAPTRELAIQVAESFQRYAAHVPKFSAVAIYGGQDYEVQFRKLRRGVQVVVGTPGRVIDHINRGTLDLSKVNTLVLDEADEMLNMGFLEDVEYVLDKTPGNRQVTLFSATFNNDIKKIAKRYLNDPVQVKIQRKTITADSIRQRAIISSHRDKIDLLIQMLEVEETDGVLVFTRTKDATIAVAEQLNRAGLKVAALNGDMPQKTRERTIERLKAEKLDIVVATDVAARGLDVTRVSHVFNYDLPEGSESYIHRVGRTGRAGRKGEAVIFLTHSQRGKLRMIERATKKTIEIVDPPSAKHLNAMRIKKLRDTVSKTVLGKDLTRFRKLIETHMEESGESALDVAAALAFLGNRGEEFFSTDKPKRERREREQRDARGNEGRDRRRGPAAVGKDMVRYRIEVGHRDGVKPGNIVGAVANEAGIEGKHIGPIQIYNGHSTIDLPAGMPDDVREILESTRVVGRELRIREATPKDEVPQEFGRDQRGGRRNFSGSRGRGGNDRGSNDRGRRDFRNGRDGRGGKGFRGRKKSGGRVFAKGRKKNQND